MLKPLKYVSCQMLFYSGYNNILKLFQFLVNNWNTSLFISNLFPPTKFRGSRQKPGLLQEGACSICQIQHT